MSLIILKTIIRETYIPLQLLRAIKFEVHLLFIRWNNRVNPYKIIKRIRLKKMRNIKLHFGCGEKIHKGWINIDGYMLKGVDYVMDLKCRLPLADYSTCFIFTEHVLEHFGYADGLFILSEFYRILKIGGVVRIIVPDLDKYCAAYMKNDCDWFHVIKHESECKVFVLNDIFLNHCHKFIYNYDVLEDTLRKAGFKNITKCNYRQSEYQELVLDSDEQSRQFESLCIEGTK